MNRHEENHVEDAINQTFAGLRDVSVPRGLESRILRTLEDRATIPPRHRHLALTWRTAAACGLTATAAAVFFFVLMPSRRDNSTKDVDSNAVRQTTPPSKPDLTPVAPPVTPGLASSERADPPRHPQLHRVPAVTHVEVAQSDNRHVNLPPPPLPLTREERLLLEIVHRRPPVELAMLTPARRAAQEQRERNEFDQFFAPSETEIEIEKLNNAQPPEQGKP